MAQMTLPFRNWLRFPPPPALSLSLSLPWQVGIYLDDDLALPTNLSSFRCVYGCLTFTCPCHSTCHRHSIKGLLKELMFEWMWLRKRVPQPPKQYLEVPELLFPSFRFQWERNKSLSIYFHYKRPKLANSWSQPVLHLILKEHFLFFLNPNPSFSCLVGFCCPLSLEGPLALGVEGKS